jgi:hypothetical protein
MAKHFAAHIAPGSFGVVRAPPGTDRAGAALGYVAGINNKTRVPRHRAYGLRDEECLQLKILTCMLPQLLSHLESTRSITR